MTFCDFFAGIGGIRLGLERAGHRCVWSCERDPFARRVYAERFGREPESDDITTVQPADLPDADLWAGGFPCQDLSVAGQRAGFGGERSSLVFTFLDLAAHLRPRWLLMENVPGMLSSGAGADFGRLLGALDDLGYHAAWRVLDARWFGVAQRRRRVFLVCHRGDGADPAAVLFEPEGVRGRAAAGGAASEDVARPLGCGVTRGGGHRVDLDHGALIAPPLTAREAKGPDSDCSNGTLVVAHTLTGEGHDAGEDGTGRGVPLVTSVHVAQDPITGDDVAPAMGTGNRQGCGTIGVLESVFLHANKGRPTGRQSRHEEMVSVKPDVPTLTTDGLAASAVFVPLGEPVAFDLAQVTSRENRTRCAPGDPAPALAAGGRTHAAARGMVRRLTPRECERLQGLPDDFTLVPWRSGMAPDSARYRAIGNGVAVPVVEWIGRRLARVERDLAAGTAVDGTPASRPGGRGREGASGIGWPGASATARPGETARA